MAQQIKLALAVGVSAVVGTPQSFAGGDGVDRFAAFAVLHGESTEAVPGQVQKRSEPVLTMDLPWETNVNNGYSSVLYDPSNQFGLGRFRVLYSASDPGFHVPDCPTNECGSGSATLLANSSDGIKWTKPNLGLFEWSGSSGPSSDCCDRCPPGICPCPACGHVNETNILFQGTTAVAIFDDSAHEKNASRRFKCWGNLAMGDIASRGMGGQPGGVQEIELERAPWKPPQVAGSAVSPDGLHWTDYRQLQGPSDMNRYSWRFDAQASMFFDARRKKYVGTDRAFRPCDSCGDCPIWWQPLNGGCRPSNVCTAAQCNRTVRAIGSVTSASADFTATEWGPNVEIFAQHDDPTHQFYSQVTWPFYNVYLGIVMVFDAVDPKNVYGQGKVHCELAYSDDPNMSSWQRLAPGKDFIPLGEPLGPGKGEWDSHICFASATPFVVDGDIRLYYMGGDGPHYSPAWPNPLHRNTSFGFATLRQDGFVALRARNGRNGTACTSSPLVVSGRSLLVTADTAMTGASIAVTVNGQRCKPLSGVNVTDQALSGCSRLTQGGSASIQVELTGAALLYTIGFAD